MDQAELEKLVVERLAKGRSMDLINSMIPKLMEATQNRIDKNLSVDNAKMNATQYACAECKNKDQGMFMEDNQHGQVTCTVCGVVTIDRKVHDGEWKRQFSGDENPSQHGPAPDPRLSSGHNLRTNLTLGSGKGPAAKVTKKQLADLKNAQNNVEMNLSNMKYDKVGHKSTRVGYKDKQKREVFNILEEVGNSLQLHDKIIEMAKGYFADYREAHEQVTHRDAVIAASLIHSLRSTSGLKRGLASNEAQIRAVRPKTTLKELHPFVCKKCGRPCGTKKDLRFHLFSCDKKEGPDLSPEEIEKVINSY